MISLFDLSFPRVVIPRELGVGSEGLLMGLYTDDSGHLSGVVITEDGSVTLVGMGSVTMAYRYDVEEDRWEDTSVPKPDQMVEEADQA